MTKIFEFIRTSPNTGKNNNGDFQLKFIVLGRTLLGENNLIPSYEIHDISTYKALGVSRYNVMESDAVRALMKAISATDQNEQVFLFISELNRIGIEVNVIKSFIETAKTNHPNLEVISLSHYGFDLDSLTAVIYKHHLDTRRKGTGCSHKAVGYNIIVSEEDKANQKRVNNRKEELIEEWDQSETLIPRSLQDIVVLRKDDPNVNYGLVIDMMKSARRIYKKNGDYKGYIRKFISRTSVIQLNGTNNTHLIYLRKSIFSGDWKMISDLPKDQLASCVSYADSMLHQNQWLIIYDHEACRHTFNRHGIAHLLSNVLWGGITDVIMSSTNRFLTEYAGWIILDEVCTAKGVTIHIAHSIGKDYLQLVKMDSARFDARHDDNKIRNTEIDSMRNNLDAEIKKMSIQLLQTKSYLRQEFIQKAIAKKKSEKDSQSDDDSFDEDDIIVHCGLDSDIDSEADSDNEGGGEDGDEVEFSTD